MTKCLRGVNQTFHGTNVQRKTHALFYLERLGRLENSFPLQAKTCFPANPSGRLLGLSTLEGRSVSIVAGAPDSRFSTTFRRLLDQNRLNF